MLTPRSYALVLSAIGLGVTVGLMAFALYLIPLSGSERVMGGNLARMGWHSRNAYGARAPQRLFEPRLFAVGTGIDGPHDVVVLGDSFTLLDLEKSWPNHLAASGLSVLAIRLAGDEAKASDADDIEAQIDALMESPEFRAHPPRVLVLEMVESTLRRRLVRDAPACDGLPEVERVAVRSPVAGPVTLQPPPHEVRDVILRTRRYDEQQLAYARDFLFRNVQRVLGRWTPEVREFELHTARFSSRHPRTLLVVTHDVHKAQWTRDDVERMRCQLLRLQRRVEAGGRTLFVAMLVPDKLSAYHADLVDHAAPGTRLDAVIDPRLNAPRIDVALRAAIEAGTLDVYLPDDTHFGAAGHAIAAQVVAQHIGQRLGIDAAAARIRGVALSESPR